MKARTKARVFAAGSVIYSASPAIIVAVVTRDLSIAMTWILFGFVPLVLGIFVQRMYDYADDEEDELNPKGD